MKLKQKIIVLNISTLLLMLIILGTLITAITDEYNLNNTLQYLENQGDYAAIYIEQYVLNKTRSVFDIPSIMETNANFLSAILQETTKCRVQIYSNRSLIGDSEDLITSDVKIRPEVEEALKKNSAYYIAKGKHRTFYYAVPISVGDRYDYSVAFIYDLSPIDLIKNNTIQIFILTGFILSFLIVFFSTIISDRITLPIKALSEVTSQFSAGNFESRATVTSNDEVGELSHTYNAMADNIHEMIEKLNEEKEKQKAFLIISLMKSERPSQPLSVIQNCCGKRMMRKCAIRACSTLLLKASAC